MSTATTIEIENLTLPLTEFTLRVGTTFSAHATGITGPSGAGKTTLLEIIAGLRRPKSGRICLGGVVLTDVARRIHLPPEERRVGYVPQDLALFPHLNVRRNLFFGHRPGADAAADGAVMSERVIDLLEIRSLLDRPVNAISGGERQRVALGRALLANPRLLLLDEPLSNLDARLKERILPYLQAVRHEFALPMVYVSHLKSEIEALCDDVWLMNQGCLGRERAEG